MEAERIITTIILGIFYICLMVILFFPSIYAGWFYYIGRKMPVKSPKKKKMLQSVLTTFLINLALVYAFYSVMFKYILPSQIQAKDNLARQAIESVEKSQRKFYSEHGRYYMIGPVRGPYSDPHGLKVSENVIVQVIPKWTPEASPEETYKAYAIHVWGDAAFVRKPDGTVSTLNNDSRRLKNLRSKMIRSVK
jgi:hypothetical protein